jgi:hypothetical protein
MMAKKTAISIVKPELDFEKALLFATGSAQKPPEPKVTVKPIVSDNQQNKRVFNAPEGFKRLTINLPESLHKKLKLAAIEQGNTATDIIEMLLNKELGN